jgi:serine protease Do
MSRTPSTHRFHLPALLLAAVLALGACTGTARVLPRAEPRITQTPALPSVNPYDPSADPVVEVVTRVAPAIVNVTTQTQSSDAIFGGGSGEGVGTGFIIRADGFLVTNFHVVEGATKITVTLPPPDRRIFQARVVGGDSEHDLAVLKVDGDGLPTVPLGNSSQVALGQRVIALGYALALPGGPTVTTGIISSLARTVSVTDPNGNDGEGLTRTLEDVFQTDAAINPGNSGGPLVDLAGNVVGINTAGAGSAENVGFAIDIDAAKSIIDQAMEDPAKPVAYLGVSTVGVDAGVAAQFGLTVDEGAFVVDLAPAGPADRAGIEPGMVIVEFAGDPVPDSQTLGELIADHGPEDEVDVVVIRQDGSRDTIAVTLGVRPLPLPTP